jgi:hypothetical protein
VARKTKLGEPFKSEASKVKRMETSSEERNSVEESQLLKRIPKNVGRPKRFTPTKFRNRINDYFAWCEKQDCYPNIKGLSLHIGICKDQFYQYSKYPEFSPIVEWARDAMEAWSMNDLWKTNTSNTNKQLVAKVNHGWNEEKTVTHVHMSKDQALAKLESLAPLLLEALKSQLQNSDLKLIEGEVVDA